VTAEPTLSGFYTINHEENLRTHLALILNADIATEVSLSAKIENPNSDPQIAWCPNEIKIPTDVPGLTGFIKGGAFFKVSASAEVSAKWPGRLYGKIGFTKGDDGVKKINTLRYTTGQTECSVNMSGEIDAGLCVRMGLAVIDDDLLSLHVTGYGGLYAKADFSLTSEGLTDGSLYSALKDSQLEVGYYFSGEPGYSILGEDQKLVVPGTSDTEFSIGYEYRKELAKWYLLPEFTQPEYTQGAAKSTAVLTATPSRDLLMPVSLGIGVEDEDGEKVDTKWSGEEYRNEDEWPQNGMAATFENLESGTYKAYPYVRVLGQELRATPECEFETGQGNVTLSDFTIDSRSYDKGAFTNDGSTYDYKFECSVTATLDYDGEIDDWGYVYEDPDGKTKMISLSAYGSSYTDSRYAYYRNSVPSYVRLYGYILPKGKSEYVYDGSQDFELTMQTTCPDNNHVHMIDLGLPSGTKWACCNVGASTPEGYGDYFAWGETTTKDSYTIDNSVSYDISYSTLKSKGIIDSNGNLTAAYDAATTNWGKGWRMPTLEEIEELLNNCTWTWTTQNGVYGVLVTGPNGNSIFLPAAGYRYGTSLDDAGSGGYYWGSTAIEYSVSGAYGLGFSSGGYWNSNSSRYDGFSVRPVAE